MSIETIEWLNNQTLIGFTDKRGTAWHYREDAQGDEPNHYPGAIPIADVERRLFSWEAVEASVTATHIGDDGVFTFSDPTRKAILRKPGSLSPDDPGGMFGVFKSGYQIHQYREWLLHELAAILDDDLNIGSSGLLQMGAKAWVQIEMPDNIVTPSGVVFRPNLLACTSHDGTIATTYSRCITNVVCDNTMSAALSEQGQKIRVKHSRNSNMRLHDVREALDIVHSVEADFIAQVERLTNVAVSDGDWAKFLDELAPIDPEGSKRGNTVAQNKRDNIDRLWNFDNRVEPWKGTAYGVVQAVNTYAHHVAGTDDKRADRNMLRAVKGEVDKLDRETLDTLAKVGVKVAA